MSIGIAIAIAAAAGGARAAPAQERVVLADPDPELLRAVRSTLAPWKLEVIVDASAPGDALEAEARADARNARFVVWRREGALVVFDRDRGSAEERDTTIGALDPVEAAAAALTVKTLMRLPPPPEDPGGPGGSPRPRSELRAQAAAATRVARGSSTEVGGRFIAALLARPLPQLEWRIGLAIDLGSSAGVERAGFQGSWADWAVIALTSWTFLRPPWEIEPQLGAGLTRSTLDGVAMSASRREVATLGMLRAGVAVKHRFGRWTLGGAVGLDRILGTPTYTRPGSTAQIFEVPGASFAFGVLAAVDFGASGG